MSEPSKALLQAVAVTAELTGTELSSIAARVMCQELALYPEPQVLGALQRCRRELKGRMSLADVISRLDDGRPGADEAWALIPGREEDTAVLTEEMQEAFGAAAPLLETDKIAARMAFKQSYERAVTDARAQRKPVKWRVSLGWNVAGREPVIANAVELGRLTVEQAKKYLPHGTFDELKPVPRVGAEWHIAKLLKNEKEPA